MSKMFPSLPDPVDMKSIFRTFPHTIPALLDYHDRLLRDWSPLTVGERELIAAFVSGLNACTYCHGAHTLAAQAFGIEPDLIEGLTADLESARVEERLKPLLAYVRKLTLTPSRMVEADARAVFEAGWDERALFDAIGVCALFNFMNRIVEGCGMRGDPLAASLEMRKSHMQRLSGQAEPGKDAHEAPPQYSRLLELWQVGK